MAPGEGTGGCSGGRGPALPTGPGPSSSSQSPRALWTSMACGGPCPLTMAMAPTRCWSHIPTSPRACPTLSPPDPCDRCW